MSDFKTIGVILGFLIGDAGILRYKEVLSMPRSDSEKLADALKEPLIIQRYWILTQRRKVLHGIIHPFRLLLIVFYLTIFVTFTYLLLVGPQKLLDPAIWGALAEELTQGELIIYIIMLSQLIFVYFWYVTKHTWFALLVLFKAAKWMRNG